MVIRYDRKYVPLSPHTIIDSVTSGVKWFSVKDIPLRDRLYILFHKDCWFEINNDDATYLGR